MEYVTLTCRLLLAGVFLVSAAGKLRSRAAFAGFAETTARLGGVPAALSAPVAAVVAAAEAVTVVLLVLPVLPLARDAVPAATALVGFLPAGALLLAFTIVLVAALLRGAATPCRCFGRAQEPVAWRHVWRNLVLLICAAVGAAGASSAAQVAPPAAALCLLGAAVAVGAVVLLDDLAHLLR